MKPIPNDMHPCAGCKHFVRIGEWIFGMPLCNHPDIRQPCIATAVPKDARHRNCNNRFEAAQ